MVSSTASRLFLKLPDKPKLTPGISADYIFWSIAFKAYAYRRSSLWMIADFYILSSGAASRVLTRSGEYVIRCSPSYFILSGVNPYKGSPGLLENW